MISTAIQQLVNYGLDTGLILPDDEIYIRNQLLMTMQLDDFTAPEGEVCYTDLESILKTLVDDAVARGVCEEDENHYLLRATERTKILKDGANARFTEDDGRTWTPLSGDTIVSMNLWGFTHSFLTEAERRFPAFLDKALAENPLKGEYFLPSVVTQLLEEGRARVKVLRSGDRWYGVTYQEDKPVVVAAIAEMTASGLYPDKLWEV